MNKYQESLNYIRLMCLVNSDDDENITENDKRTIQHLNNIQELVDKATPIKILKSVDENGEPCLPRNHGVCPICGFVVEYSDKYCCKCGKRLE